MPEGLELSRRGPFLPPGKPTDHTQGRDKDGKIDFQKTDTAIKHNQTIYEIDIILILIAHVDILSRHVEALLFTVVVATKISQGFVPRSRTLEVANSGTCFRLVQLSYTLVL